MREAPTIYLFILRAFFEENPEIREELQNHYKTAYLYGISGKGLPEKSVPERKDSLRWQFQI